MDSCLSTELILCRIISNLNLREKFGVQGVCRQWKNIAIQCLRHHEHLIISERHPRFLWFYSDCDEHPSMMTVDNDNSIWGNHTDLEFWQRTLPLLQGVKYVHMDVRSDDGSDYPFPNYSPILQLLMDSCGQSLECLCIPEHSDNDDESFPLTDSLPRLKHMLLADTTSKVTKNILSACPNLEYLYASTFFTGWQILPRGFKKLQTSSKDLDGIINLLCSPAVQSLEVIQCFVMTSEICYQSYHLSCLKKFEVTIDFDVTNCLFHLARILSFAPVLRELMIRITAFDEIEPQVWIKVLSKCQTLNNLSVYLNEPIDTENPRINVSSWQDHFAQTIVSNIKELQHLDIGFHLSSHGLRLLSQLENLQEFSHQLHTENMSYDSVFDTDALTDFLSLSLDKKLKDYYIYIPAVEPFGEYLILKESFYDFIEKMERKHFIQFNMRQNDRYFDTERVHPDKILGMIYVTDLNFGEWDLIYPNLYDLDRDEVEENLLIAVTDTQSEVQNMFFGNTT